MDASDGIRIGHLASGIPARLAVSTLAQGALIVGGSGVGKSCELVSILDQILQRVFGDGLRPGTTRSISSSSWPIPSRNTFQLDCLALALIYEQAPDSIRVRITNSVRVIT